MKCRLHYEINNSELKKLYRALPRQIRRAIGSILPNSFRRDMVFDLVDTFVISYPKAGRTWLRMLLGYVINKHYELNLKTEQLTEVHNISKGLDNCQIIKFTHDDFPHLLDFDQIERDKSKYKNKNIIFLVRDPRDLLVSYYHHYNFRSESNEAREEISLDELTFKNIGGIKSIINFYNHWLEARNVVRTFHLVRYEDLQNNPTSTLKQILEFLNINASSSLIEEALDFCSFDNLKKLEVNGKLNSKRYGSRKINGTLKTRAGKIGSHKSEFSQNVLEEINELIQSELNNKYGYS